MTVFRGTVLDTPSDPFAGGRLRVTVPPLSAVVYQASGRTERSEAAPSIFLRAPAAAAEARSRMEVGAELGSRAFAEVTFQARVGTGDWQSIGTDDNAPYRVFHDVRDLPKGTLLEYRAVVKDHSGNRAAAGTYAITGTPPVVAPVVPDPTTVTVAGSFNSELGCEGDWVPSCTAAMLTKDAQTGLWSGTLAVPAGTWEYKVAHDGAWTHDFGADGKYKGGNIALTSAGGRVTFTYDPTTHLVTTTEG